MFKCQVLNTNFTSNTIILIFFILLYLCSIKISKFEVPNSKNYKMQSTTEYKLNKLLDEFLSPECKIKDDVYFNTLLSHIENIQAQNADLLIKWILKAVLQWEKSGTPSSVLVASFLMNVLSSISRSEVFFKALQEKQIYNKLLRLLNVMDPKTPSSLKLGYARLFKSLLSHQEGITWLLDQNIWKDILNINSNNITIYLNRETQQAMSELLKKTVMVNESFCATVVKKIIDPLIDTSATLNADNEQNIEISEDKMFRSLRTTLSLINFILEDILSTADECDLKILKIFVNDSSLTKYVSVFLSIAHSNEFLYSTGKILIALAVCNLLTEADQLESSKISQILHGILAILNRNLPKLCIDNVLKLSQTGFMYSRMLYSKRKDQEKQTEGIRYLENQLLSVQLLPLVMVSKTYLSKTSMNNENYITQISTILGIDCKECIEFLSIWQDNLSKHIETHTAIKSLSYLMSSNKAFDKHNAAIICKCFAMIIKDLHNDIKVLGNPKIPLHIVTFFTHILDALCVLHSEYDVFLDSPEPVSLVNVLKDVLQLPIPSQITVKVLKLLNISLKKFSSISVDSLLEHKSEFGALLFMKFSDNAWEVRDSAVELLTTLSKYSLFQTLILENDFTSTVLKLALYDSESFVRATALQCLNNMIMVDEFWDHLNKNKDIIHYLIIKFRNETEGTVRKELATILCTIYSTNRLNDKTVLYDIMRAASDDLHWEVKMEALKFWNLVIESSLQKQDFNNVYLKEKLHDENLTIPNICHRLDAVLIELSQAGCLGALVVALQDECDIEVSKLAVTIIQPFVEFLLANKISPGNKFEDDHSSLHANEHIHEVDVTVHSNKDGIINTDEQNSGSKSNQISPAEFFRFIQQDFGCIIEERKRWLMGIDELESLVDDMLKKYEDHDDYDDNDVNPMDCY